MRRRAEKSATIGEGEGVSFPPLVGLGDFRLGPLMKAMVLERPGTALTLKELTDPLPGHGEIRLRVEACAVCRTDLHVVDGDLRDPKLPLVPGNEIVGVVDAVGIGIDPGRIGRRVGVPWLGHTCGSCPYCRAGA